MPATTVRKPRPAKAAAPPARPSPAEDQAKRQEFDTLVADLNRDLKILLADATTLLARAKNPAPL